MSDVSNSYVPCGAEREIIRRALTGRLINPDTKITRSLVEVLQVHFTRLDANRALEAVQESLDRD